MAAVAKLNAVAVRRRIGGRVAELRRANEWTQEQLATELGVSFKYVQSIEYGHENLGVDSLVALANALRVSIESLFERPAERGRRRPGRPKVAR